MMKTDRRDVLKVLAGASGALALTPFLGGSAAGQAAGEKAPGTPWPYKKLDPVRVAESGYQGYYAGACCYGAFNAIIGQLKEEVGYPYTVFPTEMMVFGEGGVAGVSSLCGALLGASAAISLVTAGLKPEQREAAFPIIRELFAWYEQEALPNYRPKDPKFEIKNSIAKSPLCHASVTRWCKATGIKSFAKERSERCGWLTASTAKYAVELLNAKFESGFKAAHKLSPEVAACRGCHDKGGSLENSRGMMDCGGCHFTGKVKHL